MNLLTTREAAERLAMHPEQVRRLIRSGQLTPIDVSLNPGGGKPRYRISEEELVRFQRSRQAKPSRPVTRKQSKVKRVYTRW